MINIKLLQKQNKLTVNEEKKIYVKPISEHGFVTYPLKDLSGCLTITAEEYVLLKAGYYKFSKDFKKLVINI